MEKKQEDSKLKQLLVESDSPVDTDPGPEQTVLDDAFEIPKSKLGDKIDELMVSWCQVISNVSSKPPVPPPSTNEHVKEVAELCVKQWGDSTHDVNTEFTRILLQWELEHPNEKFEDEMKDLKDSIDRQRTLLLRAQQTLENRTDKFFAQPK